MLWIYSVLTDIVAVFFVGKTETVKYMYVLVCRRNILIRKKFMDYFYYKTAGNINPAYSPLKISCRNVHGEVYSIQHNVIKIVSDLRHVSGFLWVLQFPLPLYIKLLLKVPLNTISLPENFAQTA
jgi:gamma-glutamylcyclotransferase (GGCT)/AIG2-like uncharacterized protein YtfP